MEDQNVKAQLGCEGERIGLALWRDSFFGVSAMLTTSTDVVATIAVLDAALLAAALWALRGAMVRMYQGASNVILLNTNATSSAIERLVEANGDQKLFA